MNSFIYFLHKSCCHSDPERSVILILTTKLNWMGRERQRNGNCLFIFIYTFLYSIFMLQIDSKSELLRAAGGDERSEPLWAEVRFRSPISADWGPETMQWQEEVTSVCFLWLLSNNPWISDILGIVSLGTQPKLNERCFTEQANGFCLDYETDLPGSLQSKGFKNLHTIWYFLQLLRNKYIKKCLTMTTVNNIQ